MSRPRTRPRLSPHVALLLLVVLALIGLAGCPTPQSPKGPPPEYEEPPAPSWLAEAGAPDAAAGDAGAAQPLP